MILYIEATDPNGHPCYIKADVVEGFSFEAETGNSRVFVSSGGFYRVKESQQELLAKLRDIDILKDREGMQ